MFIILSSTTLFPHLFTKIHMKGRTQPLFSAFMQEPAALLPSSFLDTATAIPGDSEGRSEGRTDVEDHYNYKRKHVISIDIDLQV